MMFPRVLIAASCTLILFRPYGMEVGSFKMFKVEKPVEPADKTLKLRSQTKNKINNIIKHSAIP